LIKTTKLPPNPYLYCKVLTILPWEWWDDNFDGDFRLLAIEIENDDGNDADMGSFADDAKQSDEGLPDALIMACTVSGVPTKISWNGSRKNREM
jgi:hypothetical protein